MPWSDQSQNLAPSTIQSPTSADEESLLCGLASSHLIPSQRTSTREASTTGLVASCIHAVNDTGPEQDRARAGHAPGPAKLPQDETCRKQHGRQKSCYSVANPRKIVRGGCITRTVDFTCQRPHGSLKGARWLDTSLGISAEST